MRYLAQEMEVPKEIKEVCKKNDIALIDTLHEDYGNNEKEMIIYIGDRHPNQNAHRIYAKAILRAIEPILDDWKNQKIR